MEHSQALATNLRAELARQRISGRELARMLGENVSWTHRRLAGSQEISIDDLYRIANALQIPAGDLLVGVAL